MIIKLNFTSHLVSLEHAWVSSPSSQQWIVWSLCRSYKRSDACCQEDYIYTCLNGSRVLFQNLPVEHTGTNDNPWCENVRNNMTWCFPSLLLLWSKLRWTHSWLFCLPSAACKSASWKGCICRLISWSLGSHWWLLVFLIKRKSFQFVQSNTRR